MSEASDPAGIDVTNCDREPIHLLGRIQPFGFLIAVSMDWLVQHVSANIGDFLDCDPEAVLGDHLSAVLPDNAIHSIRGRLQVLASQDGSERLFGCDLIGNNRRFDVAVHVSGSSIIIEAEPSSPDETINPGALVKSMVARIQKTTTLDALSRECVRQLRGVTGFDRVMLYRFDETGSGSVVAESVRGGLEAFFGLRYPATDIPTQARALYVRNQIRIIADIDDPAVPIMPTLNPNGKPLDLSLSLLRSVSPIHIEYLRNMGVQASFSISIVIEGKLWGLFALHHYGPRHLEMEMRAATELFGQMVSFIIEGRIYNERRQAEEAARVLHDRFIGKIAASTGGSIESIADFADELRDIIACDGIVVWSKAQARTIGCGPTVDELPALTRFLNRAAASRVYATDELSALHPPAADYVDRAAGVLAIPISRSPRDYLLFVRGEVAQTVNWAGDPHYKEKSFGPNGPRLSPRRSFKVWQETVRGRSAPWTESEVKSAEALRVSILEILLRFNEESERQQSLATQRQELLIAELNHRVRNILSLMRALVAQSRAGTNDIDQFAAIIGGRIQALARAHDQITGDNFSITSLRSIIQTEISAYIGPKASRVHLTGPEIFVDAKAFSSLALVFHEMVTNSAKYGALSDSLGEIQIAWDIDIDGNCRLSWRERGGPAVAAPLRRGFGTTIIERSIPHDLGGEARVRYALTGLEAEFTLPQAVFQLAPENAVRPDGSGSSEPDIVSQQATRTELAGLNGLVVEDNMIISLDAEQLMLDNGMARVFIAANVADARRIVATEPIDVAVLDVNLGAETSFALIPSLNERGIPFVFVTGYGEQIELPIEAGEATTIKKPFVGDQLVAALIEAASRRNPTSAS